MVEGHGVVDEQRDDGRDGEGDEEEGVGAAAAPRLQVAAPAQRRAHHATRAPRARPGALRAHWGNTPRLHGCHMKTGRCRTNRATSSRVNSSYNYD